MESIHPNESSMLAACSSYGVTPTAIELFYPVILAMLGTKINGVAKLRFVNQNAQRRKLETRTEITEAEFDAGKRPLNPWQKRPNKQSAQI